MSESGGSLTVSKGAWSIDNKFLRISDGKSLSGIRLDDIIDARTTDEHLQLITYPLVNNSRVRKVLNFQVNNAQKLENAMRKAIFRVPRRLWGHGGKCVAN